jgi:signal transduction histidine kinase
MTMAAPDDIGQAGLKFFGRTTAAFTHDLKNALAIISQNAGLMNDYLLMAEKGMPLDNARLKTVADRIDGQTRRADQLIKNMNRFAHSIDETVKSADMNELVELLAAVSFREASLKRITLVPCPEKEPLMITTRPFLLLALLGQFLTMALGLTAQGKEIQICVIRQKQGGQVRFANLGDIPGPDMASAGCSHTGQILLDALEAQYHHDKEAGSITISIPNVEGA